MPCLRKFLEAIPDTTLTYYHRTTVYMYRHKTDSKPQDEHKFADNIKVAKKHWKWHGNIMQHFPTSLSS